jgi:hypothetical protein
MPFAFLTIGVVMLIAAVRNTYGQTAPGGGKGLGALVQGDFTGPNNFVYWFVSILIIGSIGYIPKLKGFSVAFLTLVIIVLFLKGGNTSGAGGGFFSQFAGALKTTQSATPATTGTTTTNNPIAAPAGTAGALGSLIPAIPGIPNF